MTRILVCALAMALAGAHVLIGQQPQQGPPAPSAPGAGAQPSPTAPPSGSSSQDKAQNNAQMESDIRSVLSGDPALSGTDVQVSVDDMNITLTGSVQSQAQIERAVALVSPFLRYRNVVNKIAVK